MKAFCVIVVGIALIMLIMVIRKASNKKTIKIDKNSSLNIKTSPNYQQNKQPKQVDTKISASNTEEKNKDAINYQKAATKDSCIIDEVERYASWREYKQKHPLRAQEINSLGINLESKTDEDASEWIFAIETTAHDSNCKISDLKHKYFESAEKICKSDAEWILLLDNIVEFSKRESEKYNLKIGNTAGDMILLFILDKIKEVETKNFSQVPLAESDPKTLSMMFMLESNDDVLMLQKMHIYLHGYPMTEQNRLYRENWHTHMMSIIEKRISQYDNIKNNPPIYNITITTEIYKITHDEIPDEMHQGLIDEFNDHLLSFHEEMEIISAHALKLYQI